MVFQHSGNPPLRRSQTPDPTDRGRAGAGFGVTGSPGTTAGGPPRPPRHHLASAFSSHSFSPRRGGGERALSVRQRVQAPAGGKGYN
jgi:hypothetical protein